MERIMTATVTDNLDGDLRRLRSRGRDVTWPIHAEADIYFLRPDEGGRSRPVASGYRGQFYYDRHDWDAQQEFPDAEWVDPGVTARALLSFLSPDAHRGRVTPGMAFEVREGPHVVGRGRVTKVFGWEPLAGALRP
jgi:translation elongation factor EF-Tu-like GTPase